MILIYNPDLSDRMYARLAQLGAELIPSVRLSHLPRGIAAHPDIQIHVLSQNTAICAPECYAYYRAALPQTVQLYCGKTNLCGTYPGDCAYNAARIGEYLFTYTKATDPYLLQLYQNQKVVSVKQGYTKCNMLPIDDRIVFTEDHGIHNKIIVNQLPLQSILLPKGEIRLSGYPYGFIGGSAAVVRQTVIWYGNPKNCSYAKEVEEVIAAAELEEIPLSNEALCDLGGIICLDA